jgi:hypothetical protein
VQHEKADNAPMPSYFSFVFTSIDGDRVHVACLQFYEMLPLKTLRALEVRGDSPRGMHPARIAQRMSHPDAFTLCLHVWVQTKQRILTVAGSFSPSTDAGGGTDARWDEDEDSVRSLPLSLLQICSDEETEAAWIGLNGRQSSRGGSMVADSRICVGVFVGGCR